jgi:hypothetical protein
MRQRLYRRVSGLGRKGTTDRTSGAPGGDLGRLGGYGSRSWSEGDHIGPKTTIKPRMIFVVGRALPVFGGECIGEGSLGRYRQLCASPCR